MVQSMMDYECMPLSTCLSYKYRMDEMRWLLKEKSHCREGACDLRLVVRAARRIVLVETAESYDRASHERAVRPDLLDLQLSY